MSTGAGIVLILVLALALELWAIRNGRPTISRTTWWATLRRPFVALLVGILIGHLFWQSEMVYERLEAEARGCKVQIVCPAEGR